MPVGNITEADKLANLEKRGVLTLDNIKAVVMQTPIKFFAEQQQLIENCLQALTELKQLLDERCGSDLAPPTSNIQQALKFCLDTVQTFSRIRQPNSANLSKITNDKSSVVDSVAAEVNLDYGDIASKEQALSALINIANFFRVREPQSPVPHLLEQAVRWSQLSLPELLAEIVPNPDFLAHCYKLIGFQDLISDTQESYQQKYQQEAEIENQRK